MKKLFCLIMTLAMLLASVSALSEAQPQETLFTPGTYTAEAQGIFVPVKVAVSVSENEILSVVVDPTGETPELGGVAAEKMAYAITVAQTPNVDTVSGATVTSKAIIAAVTDALTQAGADIAVLDANRKDTKDAGSKTEKTTRIRDALLIGVCQAVATMPGLSRSGTTITAGIATGQDRRFAVKFSFLISIPAVLGANLLSLVKALKAGVDWPMVPRYLLGMLVAMVSGYFALNLLRYIARKGKFGWFAYYCWFAGVVTLLLTIFR